MEGKMPYISETELSNLRRKIYKLGTVNKDLLKACKMARQFFIEVVMVQGLVKHDDAKLLFIKQAIAKAEATQ